MLEILKQNLILNVRKIGRQSVNNLSGKPQKENTINIINRGICP